MDTKRTLLIGIALFSSLAAQACMCRSIVSLPDDEAALYMKRAVLKADEILRVRVLNVTRLGSNTFTYIVQVQEQFKSVSPEPMRKVVTGPDSCQLMMPTNSDWLLFIYDGRVSQCSGSAALETNVADLVGVPASEAAVFYEQRRASTTRYMTLLRGALAGERTR